MRPCPPGPALPNPPWLKAAHPTHGHMDHGLRLLSQTLLINRSWLLGGSPRGPQPRLSPEPLGALCRHSPVTAAPSGSLLDDVDEVAGDVGLTRRVGLEVTQDAVLALPLEGAFQQCREGLQPVRVVREAELAAGRQRP